MENLKSMNSKKTDRRIFTRKVATGAAILSTPLAPFNIMRSTPVLSETIIGHGDFRYRVETTWSKVDSNKLPVNNCHEMVMDQKGRMVLLTDEKRNNIIIYEKSGELIDSWTLDLTGAHGLTLHQEGGEEMLYITDPGAGRVIKCTIGGRIIMELDHPGKIGAYEQHADYLPTETAIGPNGDIYVADGYGSQFVLRYDMKGNYISKFGGGSFLQPDKFKQVHGVALDTRDPANPTLLCSARIKNEFKRFTLDGDYIESYYIPGAFVSRPVIDGENLYSGVCFGMTEGDYKMQLNRGFVTILDKNHKVVSNPGGSKPKYKNGKLQLILQDQPVFKHCHDVCIDDEKNLYVCQWNANKVYPYKLHRV